MNLLSTGGVPGRLRRDVRPKAPSLLVLLLLVFIVGCGSTDEPSSTAPADRNQASAEHDEAGRPQFRGGERSVQGFGSEAPRAQRKAVLSAFHRFLEAIASRDYRAGCDLLSKAVATSLEEVVSGQVDRDACQLALHELLAPSAARVAAEQSKGQIVRVRVAGDQGFVLFRAPGARLFVLPMSRGKGGWVSSSLSASILVPYPPEPAVAAEAPPGQ